MPIPISASSSYCSGTQFLLWYDVRTVAEALSDTDVPIPASQVPTNAVLLASLQSASGKVEAVCLVGGKYTVADLQSLTGNMAMFLAEIVAALAAPKILGRRFIEYPDYQKRLDEAEGVLRAIKDGTEIFGLQSQIDAGAESSYLETTQDVDNRALATYSARRMFGRRNNRLGPTFGGDCGGGNLNGW